ncbi:hypothetical protein UCREL1_9843 [Eutypa lata UCREL1]|uniref:Uncharacterized protein n=1 Tax=Eutypa lata (strain UCR-EL1) TaxID=1287681 RepID=M7SGE7_EUTLA|nr:hypothetical protein UCREL1_9843 [Eutypa lata UCREL1]
MLRYGSVFAFATKACLVSAVIVAYRQRIWTTVRSKMLSVAALDSLFAATEDFWALWNLEVYKQAKVAIALAILVWLAPLVIILTGNTLSVEPAFRVDNLTCPNVRTLNFVMEERENWRDPTKIGGLIGLSVSIFNSTTATNTSEGGRPNRIYARHLRSWLELGGDYGAAQMKEVSPGGMPIKGPPFPKNLGAFRTEPILWIGYSERVDPANIPIRPEHGSPKSGWDEAFVPKIFACENYETAYTVRFNHTGGQQFTEITDREYLSPVIDTQWLQDGKSDDGTNDNTVAYPEINYVFPNDDKQHYRRVAAFHSIGSKVRFFVNGTVDSGIVSNPIADTKALQTKLLDRHHEWFPYPDLMHRVQSFAEDIVLSILSDPQFLAVVWATHPDAGPSGAMAAADDSSPTMQYPCERSRFENRYRYHVSTLWAVYGVAMLVAALGIWSGTRAVGENDGDSGRLRDTRFSSIVAATRGPALEKVGWSSAGGSASRWRGGDPAGADLPADVKNLKVGYGLVHGGGAGGAGGAASSSTVTTPRMSNNNALGLTNHHHHHHTIDASPRGFDTPASSSSSTASGFQHHDEEDARLFPERALWDARDVRYGFGLEGDVSQLRSEGSLFRGRSRA